jgi:hypothetical protein
MVFDSDSDKYSKLKEKNKNIEFNTSNEYSKYDLVFIEQENLSKLNVNDAKKAIEKGTYIFFYGLTDQTYLDKTFLNQDSYDTDKSSFIDVLFYMNGKITRGKTQYTNTNGEDQYLQIFYTINNFLNGGSLPTPKSK